MSSGFLSILKKHASLGRAHLSFVCEMTDAKVAVGSVIEAYK